MEIAGTVLEFLGFREQALLAEIGYQQGKGKVDLVELNSQRLKQLQGEMDKIKEGDEALLTHYTAIMKTLIRGKI